MAKDLLSSFLPAAEVFPSRPLTLQVGATFGPFYINFFASRPTLIGTYAANPTTNTFTLANHGLNNCDMVQVTAATSTGPVTDGLATGELYFVTSSTTNTFQLSPVPCAQFSPLFSVQEIDSSDAGKVYKCGEPYNLTDCKVWAWVKHLRTDPDNQLVLDLQPAITGASWGFGFDWQVTFTKTKTQTFNLVPNVHVWSLLLQFPDLTRSLLIDNSRFTISLPTTHPNLIS